MQIGNSSSATVTDLTLKDPLLTCSDDWQFPTNPLHNVDWIGRVHRGTPWQTLYLKSEAVTNPNSWKIWSGNANDDDLLTTQPTNDWRLASLLVLLFCTNNSQPHLCVNSPDTNAWLSIFDGMITLTNTVSDNSWTDNPFQLPQFNTVVIDSAGSLGSNSPLGRIVGGISSTRSGTNYNGTFSQVGDILSVPDLSVNSPYLNTSAIQRQSGISDEAYERISSQLLTLLRPNSAGTISQSGGAFTIRYTGCDGYTYSVESSSNLLDWSSISTNNPYNELFQVVVPAEPSSDRQYYRSVLLQ